MVQLMSLSKPAMVGGGLHVEDYVEEEYGPLAKRSRSSKNSSSQLSSQNNGGPVQPLPYNPLDEPSPLGLRLRKSESFLDLIQMKLCQGNASLEAGSSAMLNYCRRRDTTGTASVVANEKLKASNFMGSILRIGNWEYKSRYEGDLVAKCYFAKHKLVWEVLEDGLKSKIEIQWSDITALKANCPDNAPGTLTVVLARKPVFYRETEPKPRKHTSWKASSDFTDQQASLHRKHFLQCSPGVLNKNYEKLISCDMRLNMLSRQPDIVMESPYFESQLYVLENPVELNGYGFDQFGAAEGSSSSGFHDTGPQVAPQSSSLSSGQTPLIVAPEQMSKEESSPSSVIKAHANGTAEGYDSQGFKGQDQSNMPGVLQSMSMSNLVSHIGHCISRQVTSGNLPSQMATEYQDKLENVAQVLLSDTQTTAVLDEKSLMKKVNSLCCLLQDPSVTSNVKIDEPNFHEGIVRGKDIPENVDSVHEKACNDMAASNNASKDDVITKQVATLPRIDSYADFLLQLPRIASIPMFLSDIGGEDESLHK